jgi:hypothetical protein
MNKIFTLASALLFTAIGVAQAPNKMSYQSVIRDNQGTLVANRNVTIQISILKGSKSGEAVYVENHTVSTNVNGLISLEIGGGKTIMGKFASIDWSNDSYFVKTATDPKGGSDFSIIGISEFLSVPYAFHALKAENGFSGNYDDLQNKPLYLSQFINDAGFVTNLGAKVTDPSTAAPTPGVPSQNWSLFGNSASNPLVDKLGTTDFKDLVIVTDNIDRLRIFANGNISLKKSLDIGEDLNVNRNVTLNILGGQTINNGNFTVAKMSSTWLTGTLDVDKTLNVDGATTLQSTLDVNNGAATHLTGLLDVDQTLNVDGATTLQSTLDVKNGSATHLTGLLDVDQTLNVDGATTLQNTLDVKNGAATHLTGLLDVDTTLNVDGATTLQSTLDVKNGAATHLTGLLDVDQTLNADGATTLKSTLVVDGVTNLNSALNVNNGAATHLTGALDVDTTLNVDGVTTLQSALNVNNLAATNLTGALTVGRTSALNGQVTISANVAGGDGSYAAHPLRVEGSAQGIAIKLTAGTPDNSNNFVTFFNGSGNAVGRIEGETTSEVDSDPEFIFEESILVAEEAKAIAAVPLAAIPVPVAVVVGTCAPCIAMAAADLILASANLIAFNVFAHENLGVTYQSGSADYAEWLERTNPNEHIAAGDIVGVNGGKISKDTGNSQQFMVISTKPAILGNMPMDGKEKLYEKVAFMGQIPVKVRGVALSGDYILPSGKNDGVGIAVSPSEIKPSQYRQIVGVAWSNALVAAGVSTINMAIGLNANDVATLAAEQDKKIAELENKFSALEQRLMALENGTASAPVKAAEVFTAAKAAPVKVQTRNEMLAANMPAELSAEAMEDGFQYLESMYAKQGINIKENKGLYRLFTDASFKASVVKKAQEKYKASYQVLLESARSHK